VVPAQRLMGAPSTVYEPTPTPGVVFLAKKFCGEPTTTTHVFYGLTFLETCSICQWWQSQRQCIDPSMPSTCWEGYIPVGSPFNDCHSSWVQFGKAG
jgi:hypothetical protein